MRCVRRDAGAREARSARGGADEPHCCCSLAHRTRFVSSLPGAPAQRDDYASPAVPGSDGCADAEDVVFFDLDDTLIDVNRRAREPHTRRDTLC
jgi:hypothetical protein